MNGTLVKKHKHLLQISVQGIYKDMILTTSQGGFFAVRTVDVKVSIRRYVP